jgi:integrase
VPGVPVCYGRSVHLSQLPSGRWRVIVKHRGQRRTGSADTKHEARVLGAELLLELGGTISHRTATVAELLAVTANEMWSPTYAAEVAGVLERMPNAFLARPARLVTPTIIRGLYRQLDWTPHRLRRVHEIMSAAYARGVRSEIVAANPFAKVTKPSAPPRRLHVPSHKETALILAACTGQDRLALWLAATLGARRGEVVALQWIDVDIERASLTIRRSLSYTPAAGVVEGDTKTGEAGHRVLAIDLPTVAMLKRHKAEQSRHALAAGLSPRWILSDTAGATPWRPDRLTYLFGRVRKQAGVEGVRLHDLRHYVATTMLEDGEHVHDVAYQLGHSNTATTLAVYAHHTPGRGRESAERRAARLEISGG